MEHGPRIILDLLGSDEAPRPEAEGVSLFLSIEEEPFSSAEIIVFGNESSLSLLPDSPRIEKHLVNKGVPMDAEPAFALRNLKDSSMAKGIEHLSQSKGDVFISAGNTGAALAFSLKYLKTAPGIDRPGILIVLPPQLGNKIIIDCGANADAKPDYLLGFARIGMKVASTLFNIEEPSVGLLNIGEEKSKGDRLRKDAYQLLNNLGKNFYGNVEPHQIFTKSVEVIVTDGFTGNILLKTLEGSFEFFSRYLKKTLKSGGFWQNIAALVLKPLIVKAFSEFQYQTYGAALLAGLTKPVLIAHGRSDAKAILNALKYGVMISRLSAEIVFESEEKESQLTTKKTEEQKSSLFD